MTKSRPSTRGVGLEYLPGCCKQAPLTLQKPKPEPEHEAIQHITYQELYVRVNEVAALLRDFCGLKKGDRVTLHMPHALWSDYVRESSGKRPFAVTQAGWTGMNIKNAGKFPSFNG
jgi:hypothetical protein